MELHLVSRSLQQAESLRATSRVSVTGLTAASESNSINAKRRALLGSQHSRQSTILPHGLNRLATRASFTCSVRQHLMQPLKITASHVNFHKQRRACLQRPVHETLALKTERACSPWDRCHTRRWCGGLAACGLWVRMKRLQAGLVLCIACSSALPRVLPSSLHPRHAAPAAACPHSCD